ncbi:MAG: hypothetical protein IJ518_08265 [Clostridia bacterium]|nr:hypothetical protein [Clostridia bacterium]
MKQRVKFLCHSVTALAIGACCYVLFRKDTYLHKILGIVGVLAHSAFWGKDLLCYYLPDCLWAYSFCYGLGAVLLPVGKQWRWVAIVVVVAGVLWEGAQLYSMVSGTADWWDCFMYLTAGVAVCIFQNRKGDKQ